MIGSDLQTWLESRNARLFRTLHYPTGYVVVIVSLDDMSNGVQVMCNDLERAVTLAQAVYDLPRADREKMALLTGAKETIRC